MCRATANVVGYANWEASITCSKPYENVWYKLDEELEEESCRTGQEVTTRLDGNGFDYCDQCIATMITHRAAKKVSLAARTTTGTTSASRRA
jgi:hypothetical protein